MGGGKKIVYVTQPASTIAAPVTQSNVPVMSAPAPFQPAPPVYAPTPNAPPALTAGAKKPPPTVDDYHAPVPIQPHDLANFDEKKKKASGTLLGG